MRLLVSQNGRVDEVGGDVDLILVALISGQRGEANWRNDGQTRGKDGRGSQGDDCQTREHDGTKATEPASACSEVVGELEDDLPASIIREAVGEFEGQSPLPRY